MVDTSAIVSAMPSNTGINMKVKEPEGDDEQERLKNASESATSHQGNSSEFKSAFPANWSNAEIGKAVRASVEGVDKII